MNNIDILEELINGFDNLINYKQKQAIETLIAENKELKENSISKSKVEELLKEIQEEGQIAYKKFMEKSKEEDFEIDGAILQELGYIEGKLQSLLGKE